MLLEDWLTIQRLLLICWECHATIEELIPVFNLIAQTLPTTQITLLVPQPFSTLTSLPNTIQVIDLPSGNTVQQQDEPVDRILELGQKSQILIHTIAQYQFEAAVIFTAWGRSPYCLAYLCYLAGIPIRIGQSQEFGGSVLSTAIQPPLEPAPSLEYADHLLRSIGLSSRSQALPSGSG